MIKVAKDFVGEVGFAVSSKTAMNMELEQFGLDSAQDVSVGLFDSKGQKYTMQDKFRYVHIIIYIYNNYILL